MIWGLERIVDHRWVFPTSGLLRSVTSDSSRVSSVQKVAEHMETSRDRRARWVGTLCGRILEANTQAESHACVLNADGFDETRLRADHASGSVLPCTHSGAVVLWTNGEKNAAMQIAQLATAWRLFNRP